MIYITSKVGWYQPLRDTLHVIWSSISGKKKKKYLFYHPCIKAEIKLTSQLWYQKGMMLVLLNPDISCLCKQCRSRSVGFWRSQLNWICTVCHEVCEFISTILIKWSDWLKIGSGLGILIYSAGQGLIDLSKYCLAGWIKISVDDILNFFLSFPRKQAWPFM